MGKHPTKSLLFLEKLLTWWSKIFILKGIKDTSNKTYLQLMRNGLYYEIPKFQRDYSWNPEQLDDLWFDLMSLAENEEM